MTEIALSGGFSNPAIEAAYSFRAALSVMAKPGTIARVTGASAPSPVSDAAATLLLTLCDPETPLFLAPSHDTQIVREWIAFHTGAQIVSAERAMFALGSWDSLKPLGRFPIGTSEYPDRSATLIVECSDLAPSGVRLTGPGIKTDSCLNLPEVDAFQANAERFPLGLDFYFTAKDQLAAMPRTTRVGG